MADERDLELLDDYLTNRMSEQDRSAFEQKIEADPDLQHEYALQKRLIRGIQDARVAELKSMLNNVSVPANATGNALASKIIGGAVIAIIIAAAGYWYFDHQGTKASEPDTLSGKELPLKEEPAIQEARPENKTAEEQESPAAVDKPAVEADKNQTSAGTEQSKPSLARKPDPLGAPGEKTAEQKAVDGPVLDVFAPESQRDTESQPNGQTENQSATAADNSSLIVETDRENRRYTFHYQFREGKLILYGPFEQNLYEIMEFFAGEKRTVFLYYKDQYYLLEEANSQVRPLASITDPALLKKLKEYRSSK
jgi:hypothetical protein